MPNVGLKFVIVSYYLATLISLDFRVTFIYLFLNIQKAIMLIKSAIVDNIHYINLITFYTSTLFFSCFAHPLGCVLYAVRYGMLEAVLQFEHVPLFAE